MQITRLNYLILFSYDVTKSRDDVVTIVGVCEKQCSKSTPENFQNCKKIYRMKKEKTELDDFIKQANATRIKDLFL